MPKTALADTMEEWTSLLAALDNPEILEIPQMEELRAALEVKIQTVKALAAEQAALQARRQAVTQQMRITRGHGQDLVIKVKSHIKGHFGHRFEGLVRYRVRPARRRSRAAREEIGITPAAIETLLAGISGLPTEALAAPEASGAPSAASPALAEPGASSPDEP